MKLYQQLILLFFISLTGINHINASLRSFNVVDPNYVPFFAIADKEDDKELDEYKEWAKAIDHTPAVQPAPSIVQPPIDEAYTANIQSSTSLRSTMPELADSLEQQIEQQPKTIAEDKAIVAAADQLIEQVVRVFFAATSDFCRAQANTLITPPASTSMPLAINIPAPAVISSGAGNPVPPAIPIPSRTSCVSSPTAFVPLASTATAPASKASSRKTRGPYYRSCRDCFEPFVNPEHARMHINCPGNYRLKCAYIDCPATFLNYENRQQHMLGCLRRPKL